MRAPLVQGSWRERGALRPVPGSQGAVDRATRELLPHAGGVRVARAPVRYRRASVAEGDSPNRRR